VTTNIFLLPYIPTFSREILNEIRILIDREKALDRIEMVDYMMIDNHKGRPIFEK
jgi:hypothetical protein